MNISMLGYIFFGLLIVSASASDLVINETCSLALTDTNFKSVIESHEFVFVMFYSATCPACSRFAPTWEKTVCSLKDENIIFAHLEGNDNQGVINAYSVSHTPTLALFHRDMASPVKYRGQQNKESILYFVKSQAGYENPGSPAVHIEDEMDAYTFSFWRGTVDQHLDVSLNGFFPTMESDEYKHYRDAVIILDGLLRCCEIISDTIQEGYNLEPGKPAIVIYRDYDERKSVYSGEWDTDSIVQWVKLMEHPSVGFGDTQRMNNFMRNDGLMVHLFVTKESIGEDWNAFQDFIFNEVVLPVVHSGILKRGTFSIIFSDGVENNNWLKSSSLDPTILPNVFLVNFKNELKYRPRRQIQFDTLATDLIDFLNDYSLGMAIPLSSSSIFEEKEL